MDSAKLVFVVLFKNPDFLFIIFHNCIFISVQTFPRTTYHFYYFFFDKLKLDFNDQSLAESGSGIDVLFSHEVM